MVGKLRDTKTSRSCQPSSSSARGDALARVARVPINFARHVHHDCQHDEERDCAHEQCVILLPEGDVEKSAYAGQPCSTAALQKSSTMSAINSKSKSSGRSLLCSSYSE